MRREEKPISFGSCRSRELSPVQSTSMHQPYMPQRINFKCMGYLRVLLCVSSIFSENAGNMQTLLENIYRQPEQVIVDKAVIKAII